MRDPKLLLEPGETCASPRSWEEGDFLYTEVRHPARLHEEFMAKNLALGWSVAEERIGGDEAVAVLRRRLLSAPNGSHRIPISFKGPW